MTRKCTIFGTRARFVMMTLVLLCLTAMWSNILTFNFAVICMAPDLDDADAHLDLQDKYLFTKSQKTYATVAVAAAAFIFNFPVVFLANKVGIRTVFALLGILSSVATLVIPLAIRTGFGWLLVCRFLQGVGFAGNFPVIGSFTAQWTYYKQTGLFVSVLVAYVQLSPILTMPTGGPLCSHLGWASVFYVNGAASLVLFILYGLFYRNSPLKHPFVGEVEIAKIAMGKATVEKKLAKVVPYGAILRTPSIWAVWIGAVGNFFAVNLMYLFNPIYLSAVLGFSANQTGFSAAVPPILQFLVKIGCGAISDKIKFITEANKFRFFNSLAFLGSATCFIVLTFVGTDRPTLNVVLLGGAAGFLGATTGGFYKAAPFLSKQHSHFVTGNISLVLTLTMIIVPFVTNGITTHNTEQEWNIVFLIAALMLVLMNIVFICLIKGEPCEWTKDEWIRANSMKDLASLDVKSAVSAIPPPAPVRFT